MEEDDDDSQDDKELAKMVQYRIGSRMDDYNNDKIAANLGGPGWLQVLRLYNDYAHPGLMYYTRMLAELNLADLCHLTELPESIYRFSALTVLNLARCKTIVRLPETLGQLKSLKHLTLAGCSALTCLPESAGQLKSLTLLHMATCSMLDHLPDSIGEMTALTTLDLYLCTGLRYLPDSIGLARNLMRLNIGRCRMARLPLSLCQLEHLRDFDIAVCDNLVFPPRSVVCESTQNILIFMTNRYTDLKLYLLALTGRRRGTDRRLPPELWEVVRARVAGYPDDNDDLHGMDASTFQKKAPPTYEIIDVD